MDVEEGVEEEEEGVEEVESGGRGVKGRVSRMSGVMVKVLTRVCVNGHFHGHPHFQKENEVSISSESAQK